MVKHINASRNSANASETFAGNVLTSSYTEQNFPFSNLSLVTAYTQKCFLSLSNALQKSIHQCCIRAVHDIAESVGANKSHSYANSRKKKKKVRYLNRYNYCAAIKITRALSQRLKFPVRTLVYRAWAVIIAAQMKRMVVYGRALRLSLDE